MSDISAPYNNALEINWRDKMIELLLPGGIIGSLFFMFWIVKFPQEVYETMIFKDGDILWGLGTWLFLLVFIGTIVFVVNIAI